MLTWEKIPGSPRLSVLQVMKSWAGPGNEATQTAIAKTEHEYPNQQFEQQDFGVVSLHQFVR